MIWDRFHFLCRHHKTYSSNYKHEQANLYGPEIPSNHIAFHLLDALRKIKNDKDKLHINAIYSQINFASKTNIARSKPRASIYLGVLTIVYLLTSLIYQIFVLPTFTDIFSQFQMNQPNLSNMMLYPELWGIQTIVVIGLLLFFIYISLRINFYSNYASIKKPHFLDKIIIPKKIRSYREELQEIVAFPLIKKLEKININSSTISVHLSAFNNNLLIGKEMEALINAKQTKINTLCRKYITLVNIFSAIFVIASIFILLRSVYSSIYAFGGLL